MKPASAVTASRCQAANARSGPIRMAAIPARPASAFGWYSRYSPPQNRYSKLSPHLPGGTVCTDSNRLPEPDRSSAASASRNAAATPVLRSAPVRRAVPTAAATASPATPA